MNELLEQLKQERDKAWYEWEALNLPTFESDYEETYEDTVARLNAEGYYDGLARAVAVLESASHIPAWCADCGGAIELGVCAKCGEEVDNA